MVPPPDRSCIVCKDNGITDLFKDRLSQRRYVFHKFSSSPGWSRSKAPCATKPNDPRRHPMFRALCGCAQASRLEVDIGPPDLVERIHDERPAGDDLLIYWIGVTQNDESGTVCSN